MVLQRTRRLAAAQLFPFAGRRSAVEDLSGGRSPMNAVALSVRRTFWAVLAAVLVVLPSLAIAGGGVTLRLAGPTSASAGRPLVLRFTVTNAGSAGVYFKQPWKWASNGMRVIAVGDDGSRHESSPMLFDIDSQYLCTYFKPLSPGDEFSFEETLRIGPKPALEPPSPLADEAVAAALRPSLDLRPGRYRLRWVYEPKLYAHERKCTAAGWPIWTGRLESSEIALHVTK